jgi:hypothetical protein
MARGAILSLTKLGFVGAAFSRDHRGWKAAPTGKNLTSFEDRLKSNDSGFLSYRERDHELGASPVHVAGLDGSVMPFHDAVDRGQA